MSSKISEKKYKDIIRFGITEEKIINLKKILISFSQLSGLRPTEFIYTGKEKIPFNDTHPAYQTILRHEFADAIQKTFKEKKKSYSCSNLFRSNE